MITGFLPFVRLSRPHFLLGAALLYGLGAAAVFSEGGQIDWQSYWLGQGMVTAIQLVTHFSNEFFDLASDRASENRTWLTGGSGVLVEGRLSAEVALRAAAVSAAAAAGLVVWTYLVAPVVAVIGTVALFAGWFYSAPPLRLEASGAGEIVATVVVAVLVPSTAALMQTSSIPEALVWAMAGLAPLQFAMMVAFSLPDLEADRSAGKLVLAARLGLGRSRVAQALALITGFAALALGIGRGSFPSGLTVLLLPAAVAAVLQVASAGRRPGVVLVTAAAATLLLATAGLLVVFLGPYGYRQV